MQEINLNITPVYGVISSIAKIQRRQFQELPRISILSALQLLDGNRLLIFKVSTGCILECERRLHYKKQRQFPASAFAKFIGGYVQIPHRFTFTDYGPKKVNTSVIKADLSVADP